MGAQTVWDYVLALWDMRKWHVAHKNDQVEDVNVHNLNMNEEAWLIYADQTSVTCGNTRIPRIVRRAGWFMSLKCPSLSVAVADGSSWMTAAVIRDADIRHYDDGNARVLSIINELIVSEKRVAYIDANNYDTSDRGGHQGRDITELCRNGCAITDVTGITPWSFIEFYDSQGRAVFMIQPFADAPYIEAGGLTDFEHGMNYWWEKLPLIIPPLPFRFGNELEVSKVMVWAKPSQASDYHVVYIIAPLTQKVKNILGF